MQVEDNINTAVMDLTNLVSSLNLLQTLALRRELLQHAAQVAASGVPLEQAQQQDALDLKGRLGVLVGGQQALAEQLAAAFIHSFIQHHRA